MSVTNSQLVKWSFPALALIIGLFWYKRRRVDRVDPGGKSSLNKKAEETNNTQKNTSNLYDSGIHIDESFSSNQNTEANSPRKRSESLDIPNRKLCSQSISIKSGKSSGDSQPWYGEDENTIILGSKPQSSSFGMMARNKSLSSEIKEQTKSSKIFKHVAEEEEPISNVTTKKTLSNGGIATGVKVADGISEDDKKMTRCQAISERDSANHSPVSGVLDGSVNDEVRSEGSTDSGKGGSINGKVSKSKCRTTYDFEIPQRFVGRLIGRRGLCIQGISAQAGVMINVIKHPKSDILQLCVIEGLPDNIRVALEQMRKKFPLDKYPELTLENVNLSNNPAEIPWSSELLHLHLAEGVNNDVWVCHIQEPNRIFIQLPTHPTYPSLRLLDYNMTQFYNTVESPPVPVQLTKGMLVVAKWFDNWVRAYVEEPDETGEKNLVRLVDHGGFWTFSNAEMRKIRSDYIALPFQAIEVYLANVNPIDGEWPQEAYDVVAQICSGTVAQAQIEAYVDSNIFVSLYINVPRHGVISVAHELVARGLAEATAFEEVVPPQTMQEN